MEIRIKILWNYTESASLCNIVSQRSSLELASLVTKAGSSPQNLWPILCDIGASQVATQLRQFLCTTGFLSTTPLTYYTVYDSDWKS